MQNSKCKIQNAEFKMQNSKCKMQNAELSLNSQLSTLNYFAGAFLRVWSKNS